MDYPGHMERNRGRLRDKLRLLHLGATALGSSAVYGMYRFAKPNIDKFRNSGVKFVEKYNKNMAGYNYTTPPTPDTPTRPRSHSSRSAMSIDNHSLRYNNFNRSANLRLALRRRQARNARIIVQSNRSRQVPLVRSRVVSTMRGRGLRRFRGRYRRRRV